MNHHNKLMLKLSSHFFFKLSDLFLVSDVLWHIRACYQSLQTILLLCLHSSDSAQGSKHYNNTNKFEEYHFWMLKYWCFWWTMNYDFVTFLVTPKFSLLLTVSIRVVTGQQIEVSLSVLCGHEDVDDWVCAGAQVDQNVAQ